MSSVESQVARVGPSRRAVVASAVLIALIGLVALVIILLNPAPTGDAGRLSEPVIELPDDLVLPVVADATEAWGLSDVRLAPAVDAMAGGVAAADLDGDLRNELIVANGEVVVLRWEGEGFGEPQVLDIANGIGVSTADVDLDGFVDLLVATAGDVDVVVWGGEWITSGGEPAMLELAAPGQSSGLLAAELSGDGLVDIVRLGRGMGTPEPDILWTATSPRAFDAVELPVPDRFTLAGELADVDRDGLLDIWLTRDVGWSQGADSVLSRQGDPTGAWVDVAVELGVALEVDGMGITLADLNGDAELDAYVSDLGDNEVLLGSPTGYQPAYETGAAHIRPVAAGDDVVSSTWGTGAIDINLDGVVDLVVASGGFPNGKVRNKIDGTEVALEEQPALLLGLGDGTFVDVWSRLDIDLGLVARGLTVADLDFDGDDDVAIVDRRGFVYALRNDADGPTITTYVEARCGPASGWVATIATDVGSYQRLLAPHGYASSHAAQVIVGNPTGGNFEVQTNAPGELADTRAPFAVERPIVSLTC